MELGVVLWFCEMSMSGFIFRIERTDTTFQRDLSSCGYRMNMGMDAFESMFAKATRHL